MVTIDERIINGVITGRIIGELRVEDLAEAEVARSERRWRPAILITRVITSWLPSDYRMITD